MSLRLGTNLNIGTQGPHSGAIAGGDPRPTKGTYSSAAAGWVTVKQLRPSGARVGSVHALKKPQAAHGPTQCTL